MATVLKISRKELQRRSEICGLQLMSPALTLMETEVVNAFPSYESIDDFLKQFIQVLMTDRKPDSYLIDAQTAQQTIDQLRERRVSRTADNQLVVKNVVNSEDPNRQKSKKYLQHLSQLSKYLEKHPIFHSKNFKLTKIDSLIISSDETIDCIVFGFLIKDPSKINEFVVEDSTGRVPLVFTDETQFRNSLITENSFVLIEGTYDSSKDILEVDTIGLPPPIDLKSTIQMSNSLQRLGRMIVVLADIHLDDDTTLDKLQTLLTGYESTVPIPDVFIFVGDFTKHSYEDVSQFKACMKNFVKILSRFDKISRLSQIIFVPGFNDGDGQQIPKHPFAVDMFPQSTTRISNYYLATNPVNIYIDGRHICLLAFPLLSNIKKHTIHDSTEESTEFGSALAKHILCNAHLNAGTTKNLESCLSLFHLPDFLIVSDKDAKQSLDSNAYEFVDFVNLPSFSRHEFKFKVFYTNPKLVENSQILSRLSLSEIDRIHKTCLSPALIHQFRQPVVITAAKGQYVWDNDTRYLDMFGGIVTTSVGHCHPVLVERLSKQLNKIWHTSSLYYNEEVHEYASQLVEKFPEPLNNIFFCNSGSEANDIAMLLARLYTEAHDIIALRNAYHGMATSTQSLCGIHTWKFPTPTHFGVHHTTNPDPYTGRFGGAHCRDSPIQTSRQCDCSPRECRACDLYIEDLEQLFETTLPKRIAGFFAESIQGVGGVVQYPKQYLKRAFELVRKRNGVCIIDEVQTGFGRTGTHYWGFEGHEVLPDIVTMAKGMGNGFPMAAVITRPEIAETLTRASYFNTFGGNPLSACVGLNVLKIIDEEKLQNNCLIIGSKLLAKLAHLRTKYPDIVGDVRGKGLMIGMELIDKVRTKPMSKNDFDLIIEDCKAMRLLIGRGGPKGNVFRIKPPMCVNEEDIDFTVEVLDKALQMHCNRSVAKK